MRGMRIWGRARKRGRRGGGGGGGGGQADDAAGGGCVECVFGGGPERGQDGGGDGGGSGEDRTERKGWWGDRTGGQRCRKRYMTNWSGRIGGAGIVGSGCSVRCTVRL